MNVHLLSVKQLFADHIIPALCWMLVHSLWQGLLLALMAGAIVLFTKKSSPGLRYNLLSIAFILFIISVGFTFLYELNMNGGTGNLSGSPLVQSSAIIKNVAATDFQGIDSRTDLLSLLISFLNAHAFTIVFTWFLLSGFQYLRMIGGLYGIYRITHRQTFGTGEYWNNRIEELRLQLQINKPVSFLQSGIVKVPIVLGHFKPVILFPLGILSSLHPDDVEAILIHELAHIRRKDYIMNMLQHIFEILFFFNPALVWVSSLIRREREHCCDDIAVAKAGSKRNYIKALLSFQEYSLAKPPYAMALTGGKYHLLDRVKRIAYNNNKTLNKMEKIFLGSALMVTGILAITFSTNDQPFGKKNPFIQGVQQLHSLAFTKDTVPANNKKDVMIDGDTIRTYIKDKLYKIIVNNDKVTELYIDDKKVPDEKIRDYKPETDKLLNEIKTISAEERAEVKAKQMAELDMVKEDRDAIRSKEQEEELLTKLERSGKQDDEAHLKENQLKLQKELALIEMEKSKKQSNEQKSLLDQRSIELKLELELEQRALAEKDNQLKNKDEISKTIDEQLELETRSSRDQAKQMEMMAEKYKTLAEESQIKAKEYEKKAEQYKVEAEKTTNDILNDLLQEKVIKDKKNASFVLNSEVLIVNGVKQPESLHQKFKEKYVRDNDWNFNYKYDYDYKSKQQ